MPKRHRVRQKLALFASAHPMLYCRRVCQTDGGKQERAMRNAGENNNGWRRRDLLSAGLALAGGGAFIALTDQALGATATINMQLGWLAGGNQIGEIAAFQLGYFEQEGLDFKIQ